MLPRPAPASHAPDGPGRRSDVLEGGPRGPVGLLAAGAGVLAVLALLGSRPEAGSDAWQELQHERTPAGQLVLAAHCAPTDSGCGLLPVEQAVTVSAYGLPRPDGRVEVVLGLSNASPQPLRLLDVVLPAGLRREASAEDAVLPLAMRPSRSGSVPRATSLSLVVAPDCSRTDGTTDLGPVTLLVSGSGSGGAATLTASLAASGLPQRVVDTCASGWRAS